MSVLAFLTSAAGPAVEGQFFIHRDDQCNYGCVLAFGLSKMGIRIPGFPRNGTVFRCDWDGHSSGYGDMCRFMFGVQLSSAAAASGEVSVGVGASVKRRKKNLVGGLVAIF